VRGWPIGVLVLVLAAGLATLAVQHRPVTAAQNQPLDGKTIFRFDTFGDEQLWTDQLRLNKVIESSLDPLTALQQLGLKVDVEALPAPLIAAIGAGEVDLTDPATTLALIKLNAVVGVVPGHPQRRVHQAQPRPLPARPPGAPGPPGGIAGLNRAAVPASGRPRSQRARSEGGSSG
jgi:hypothetical protein